MSENKTIDAVIAKFILKSLLVLFCFLVFWLAVVFQSSLLAKYLTLGAALFCIGLYGIFKSKSVLKTLICLEILFNSAILNMIAFARFTDVIYVRGQVFSLFIMAVAAAEAALGLALVIAVYRMKRTTSITQLSELKG
ncbi:MAG: NADH-quinone oxidoreductase subunit NuoK [Candidatus Caenarcaniphilales bacterium]|nr:NADH-quinone oxidoreductase subunit NuoK [Candidatus Caenarcaniphilales bacterium]